MLIAAAGPLAQTPVTVGDRPWLSVACTLGATHLPYHGAPIADQLGQHHGHVVVDGGRMVSPLRRVAHKRAEGEDSCTAHLQGGDGSQACPAARPRGQGSLLGPVHCAWVPRTGCRRLLPILTAQGWAGPKEVSSPLPAARGGTNFWSHQ